MKKQYLFLVFAMATLVSVCSVSCSKEKSATTPTPPVGSPTIDSSITVSNMSGTYSLTALTWTYGGISVDIYDSLEPCEKDNTIELDSNLTAKFIDAGQKCTPPEDSTGMWHLSGDSLYVGDNETLIQSFNGKTLVLNSTVTANGITAAAKTTLVKQ